MAIGRLLVALVVVLVTAGNCASVPGMGSVGEGSAHRSVAVGDTDREYRVYRPKGISGPAPLVMVLHGYTGNAAQAEEEFGWNELADQKHFVAAYPEGLNEGFNAGGCCGASSDDGVDDVAAVLAMLDDVAAAVPLDPERLYVTGFSNGGAMAYRLACETDRFAAFGPVAGGLVANCQDPEPTSILHVHGTSDRVVPFDGVTDIWRTPVVEVLADWRERDDCGTPAATTKGRTQLTTASCAAGREVGLLAVDGLDHAWPTADDGLDATETLWAFFERHPRGH